MTLTAESPATAAVPPFPVGFFTVPPRADDDPYTNERRSMIEDALLLAAGAADRDPEVNASRDRIAALVERVNQAIKIGRRTDGSDDNLGCEISNETLDLSVAAAYCIARAWLWDRGSIPLDRQTLIDHYNRTP